MNTKNLRKAGVAWLAVALLSSTLTACGTLEVSVERTATPDHAVTATVATQVAAQVTPPSLPQGTITHRPGWETYTSQVFYVALQYPPGWGWQPIQGYDEKYGGPDGFFQVSAAFGPDLTVDEACELVANHKLKPYGSQPQVKRLQVQRQEACLIWPSDDQARDMKGQAALIVRYPQPIQIAGDVYGYLVLWADKDHLREIAETLKFTFPGQLSGPTTPFTDTVLGIALDTPAGWEVDGHQGAEAHFLVRDETGMPQGVLTFSVLSSEGTLESALDEVKQGAWGPYIRDVQRVRLGEFQAMRLELEPGEDWPPVIWLVVPPSGRAVGFTPDNDPALAEAVLSTLRAVPVQELPISSVRGRPVLLYRDQMTLYAWDEAANQGQRLLDLPDVAGHLALSPLGYLAYTVDDTLYLADLSAGTAREIYGAWGRTAPDWDLRWCTDGRVLAYALAYEEQEPDVARRVELGTHDGYAQRVITSLTARSGPLPTPPPMPPAPPEPGFANLQLLGYDRAMGRILAVPAGGAERYSAVWSFDTVTGQQTTLLAFDDPAAVQGLATTPNQYPPLLAVGLTPARIAIYDLAAPQAAPRTYDAPAGTYPGTLHWSPDGKGLAFLLYGGEVSGLEVASARGLWVLEVETMEARQITELESPEATLIGWHPDGKTLLVEWLDALSFQVHHQQVDIGPGHVTDFPLGEGARIVGWVRLP